MLLQSILAEKFETDDRVPVATVQVPYFGTFGITEFPLLFWIQSFLFLACQSVINIVAAVIIYHLVLKAKNRTQAYLIGYGVIIPILLYLPFFILPRVDLRNIAMTLCLCASTPAILTFRCIEAMHGTMPTFFACDQNAFSNFLLYYASSLQFDFDPKTQSPVLFTRQLFWMKLKQFARLFIECSLLFSVLLQYNFQLFPRSPITNNDYDGSGGLLSNLFFWGNIGNNYIMAYLTSLVLETGSLGLGLFFSVLCGYNTMKFSHDPLTASTSPSDFWGKRWNCPVGSAFRRGVYQPLRKSVGLSAKQAALCTFLVSGILHEYVLTLMTLRKGIPNNPEGSPFEPKYGNHLLFFVWNGAVLLAEHVFAKQDAAQWLATNLPRPARTALVLLTVLPISHLFTDEYINCCFYSDLALGFPKVVKLHA